MLKARFYNFDERAGDPEWRSAVSALYAARETYLQTVADPPKREPAPARPSGHVIDLAVWREVVASERDPLEEAAEAYRNAAMRLLMAWAPNSSELREQIRLAAELLGVPDPMAERGYVGRRAQDIEATPSEILRLLFHSSLGLWRGEQRASQRASK